MSAHASIRKPTRMSIHTPARTSAHMSLRTFEFGAGRRGDVRGDAGEVSPRRRRDACGLGTANPCGMRTNTLFFMWHANQHSLVPICADMRIGMRIDMRIDMCMDMRRGMHLDMHMDMRMDMRIDMCTGMRVNMRVDMHVDMRAETCV